MTINSLPKTVAQTARYFPPLPALRDFISMYRLNAKRVLSQNYLMDMNLIRKIIQKAGNITDNYVIEIGPGPGGITRAILEKDCKRLDVIEIDRRFIPPLEILQLASNNRLFIHQANVLQTDLEKICQRGKAPKTSWYDDLAPMHIIGNLPFNVATPVIIKFLKEISYRKGAWSFGRVPLTLTFQSEVAKRIVGNIDSQSRSRISLMAQYLTEPKLVLEIPGDCFVPKPQVNVGVVRFVPRTEPLIPIPFEIVEKMARHLFIHRRKFIYKNIRTLYPREMQYAMTNDLLKHCRVSPNTHCTKIGMEEFRDMCIYYEKQCQGIPGLFFYDHSRRSYTLEMLRDKVLPSFNNVEQLHELAGKGLTLKNFGKNLECI